MQFAIQAKASLINEDYHQGAILFTKALYHMPDEPEFHKGKAMTFLGLGDIKSAVICLGRAAQLNTQDTSTSILLADLYSQLGDLLTHDQDYGLAHEYYAEAVRFNPNNHKFFLNRIECLEKSGRDQEAVDCISEMTDPGSRAISELSTDILHDLILLRIQLYLKLERYEDAIIHYQIAIRDIDRTRSRYDQIIQCCRQAALDLHTNAKAQILMSKFSKALALMDWAIKLSNDSEHYRLRATIHRMQGNYSAALVDLEEGNAKESDPVRVKQINIEAARIENDLAVEKCARQEFDVAINHLHRAILFDPDQYQYYVNRADCNLKLQRYNHAQGQNAVMIADMKFNWPHLADYHEADRLVMQTSSQSDRQRIQIKLSALHFQFGVDAFNRRALSEAVSEFTEAIRLSKQRIAQYFISRAETFEQMQNVSMTMSDYLKAVEIDPKAFVARNRLSALSAGMTDNDELPIRVVDLKPRAAQSHVQQILARRNARKLRF